MESSATALPAFTPEEPVRMADLSGPQDTGATTVCLHLAAARRANCSANSDVSRLSFIGGTRRLLRFALPNLVPKAEVPEARRAIPVQVSSQMRCALPWLEQRGVGPLLDSASMRQSNRMPPGRHVPHQPTRAYVPRR